MSDRTPTNSKARKTRRQFLTTSAATALGLIGCSKRQQDATPASSSDLTALDAPVSDLRSQTLAAMPRRILGRTQIELPVLGLGGAGRTPLSNPNQEQAAIEQIQRAFALGIRYFDTAASYGPSEQYLGKALPPHRSAVFLASKTAKFDYDGAWRELERSLRRLNTDYLDLWQFHHVSFESELDTLFGPNGAGKVLEEAKTQGLVRFSGITGHHEPEVIATALQRYPFDHTLIPVNAADIHHPRPFIPTVLPVAQAQNVAVTAMKVPAYGKLLKPGVLDGMYQALGYTLSQPGVHGAVIAAATIAQLEENVRAAVEFQQLNESNLANIEQKTATVWQENTFFRAWT